MESCLKNWNYQKVIIKAILLAILAILKVKSSA